MDQGAWSEYEQWDEALAARFFGDYQADLPAYINVENTSLIEDCAKEIGLPIKVATDALVASVRPTLGLGKDEFVLARHALRYDDWRRQFMRSSGPRGKRLTQDLTPPPVIALLTTLVLAAEKMGADTNLAANAYYPRLGQLFGLTPRDTRRLVVKFPITESFWRGLNEYLEAQEGLHGLPTAYALGHRYVGIPQSQALVRAMDRGRLPAFFRQFGLAPGSELIAADLERLLDVWIRQTPSPVTANLRRLWQGGKARERIAGVVAVELAHWDGTVREASQADVNPPGEVQLTALLRQQFGSRSLELSFAARFSTSTWVDSLRVESAEGKPLIGVIPAAGARLRPTPGSKLDPNSLVGSILTFGEPGSGQTVTRRPRRVVPLRKDELLGILVEVEKVQLADDAVLMVKDDRSLVADVLDLVEGYGHHGTVYRSGDESGAPTLPGLPEGWALIDDVQLYAIPQGVQRLDLHALIPLTTAQLNLSGGLKLPGRIRKWSSLQPPEIRAAVAEAAEMSITLTELGEDRVTLQTWSEPVSAMVVPLAGLGLDDGDYEVELAVNGSPISLSTLRLRSGQTPDAVNWATCMRLNYEIDRSQLGPLSAVEAGDDSTLLVDGLNTIGARAGSVKTVAARAGAGWSTRHSSSSAAPAVVLGVADPKSCVVTGAHYLELPTFYGGKVKGQIQGVCKMCGLKKSLPATPRWKKSGTQTEHAPAIKFSQLPSHSKLGATWDECMDALVHVGGGSIGSFERVATQAEGSSLFVDGFLRTLETVGHIDVRRDSTLQPKEWEANPAYLAETLHSGFVLAGVWCSNSRDALGWGLRSRGGELVPERHDDHLTSWFARGVGLETLTEVVSEVGIDAYVVPDAVTKMLAALPPISEVEAGLTLVPIPDYTKAALFDVHDASWRPVPGVGAPGAYRLEQSFRTTTLWVDHQGALDRLGRVSSVQLVKHLAARASGAPLLGYLDSQSMLLVPLGAELPGLYGRVAALCSGRAPVVSVRTRSIGYPEVPRWFADHLNSLLAS
ncbi:MAG: hypothetical protein WA892_14100 [Ornithinimicrobium sp.]